MAFLSNEKEINSPATIVTSLNEEEAKTIYTHLLATDRQNATEGSQDLEHILSSYQDDDAKYKAVVDSLPVAESIKYESGFQLFKHKIPMWIFLFTLLGLTVWAFRQNLSLIPLLGLICCLYMMAELSVWNWIYFTIWLLVGLLIYFGFSRKNSKLNLLKI
jgi:hypothetical protein